MVRWQIKRQVILLIIPILYYKENIHTEEQCKITQ